MDIYSECAKIRAAHDDGPRPAAPRRICLHSTEGDTAVGAASWFANPASGGSAHKTVDANSCYRSVPDNVIAWGAAGDNTNALHLEQAAHAAWTKTSWMNRTHRKMLKRGAYHVARWCKEYDIPDIYLTLPQIRANHKGIEFHYQVTQAFGISTHTDPGPNFPKRTFMRFVRKELKRLG